MDNASLAYRFQQPRPAAALHFVHRASTVTTSFLYSSMKAKAHTALRVGGAVVFCAAVAALLSLPFQHQDLELRSKVPLVFLIVIVMVARKMGEAAAILGTVVAGLVFATLLFQPLGSLGVAAKPARMSLAWFLLGGMVCAHLLSPHTSKTSERDSGLSHDRRDAE